MKNIMKIFRADLKSVFTNFFVLVIAGGLCLLPALYAWFNIYANWDPYSNTGNISIAVVNLDKGWTKDDGEFANMGDSVVESLKEKDSIGWVFLEEEKKAVDGVKAGKYYAALVIDSEFTYSMYKGAAESVISPKLTYYVNDKKNAVATKITDTAVGTVQSSINKQFVQVLAEGVFKEANSVAEDIKKGDNLTALISKLEKVRDSLGDYDRMIDTFIKANGELADSTNTANDGLKDAKKNIEDGKHSLSDGREQLSSSKTAFQSYSADVSLTMKNIEESLDAISQELEDAKLDQDARTLAKDVNAIKKDLEALNKTLDKLYEKLKTLQNENASNAEIAAVLATIENIKKMSEAMSKDVDVDKAETQTGKAVNAVKSALDSYSDTVSQINKMYTNQIVPQVNNLMDQMSDTLKSVEGLLDSLCSTTEGMGNVFAGVNDTIGTMNLSLDELKGIIKTAGESLDKVLNQLDGATESQQIDILLTFLGGDPESLGMFFSEPVQVENNYIYEIENYGSGVAPFYTTLAIWVGMTILVSMIKVHAKSKDLTNVKPYQLFFGRYLLFFMLSQIQTLIIVIGNLYVFKIQCLHPFAFWGAAAMASLTFSLLIYSLTIAFGDIGKAVAVVVMVIQIAGSGGTYPIEALPTFFQAVYFFFPFPHAINAMRECIGGMYENNYYIYLSKLVLFCVAALVIGLVIRVPFIKFNHYIEERMEDTEML